MVAKEEEHKVLNNKQGANTESPQTMVVTSLNESTTTEPLPLNGQQFKSSGVLKCIYWYQIFALDSVVAKTQKLFSSHGGFLTIARNILNKFAYYETKTVALDSQIVGAKENLKLSHCAEIQEFMAVNQSQSIPISSTR